MIENKFEKPSLDFVVIGFTKCASTWLYNCLDEHLDICVARPKESDFFIKENLKNNPKRIERYNNFFNHCKTESVVGEVSPMYIEKDVAFENILNNYPNVKLLVLLRSPLDREISILLYKKRFNKEKNFNLKEELKERIKDSKFYYSEYLKKWFDNFPKENILPIILESVSENPEREIGNIYSFLGVDKKFIPNFLDKKLNRT
ncbi:sulfotransferase domain-containing protein, partial [bacterium]|nr:sulfotransferase domain-containing protein [bacterium]